MQQYFYVITCDGQTVHDFIRLKRMNRADALIELRRYAQEYGVSTNGLEVRQVTIANRKAV